MSRSFPVVLILFLFSSFGAPTHLPQDESKAPMKPLELTPRRPECAILFPERDERRDVARLVRADQFLDCERDGFPKHLAPPWKETVEGEKKLGDACEYFATKSAKEYPQLSQASLKLAADRCRVNVLQVMFMEMGKALGQPPK